MSLNTLVTNTYGQLIIFYIYFRLLISCGVKNRSLTLTKKRDEAAGEPIM